MALVYPFMCEKPSLVLESVLLVITSTKVCAIDGFYFLNFLASAESVVVLLRRKKYPCRNRDDYL